MSGSGGGSTQASGPAPIPLLNKSNTAFGSTPWYGTQQAQGSAYNGIQGLNTNPASQYGQAAAVGQNLTGQGNNMVNQGQGLSGQAMGAWQAGQDPQNALYAREFQKQQDQSRAANAASGVASSPYGAALETQGNQNFNLDWQNNQLQRQQTAAGTASTLAGAGSGLSTAGGNLAATGLGMGQSIDTQQFNAQQTQIQDLIQYLLGNTSNSQASLGAANNTYASALNGAGLNNTAAQQANQGLMGSLGGLGSLAGAALPLFL